MEAAPHFTLLKCLTLLTHDCCICLAKFKAVAENAKEVESIIEAILESFRKITDDVVGEVK